MPSGRWFRAKVLSQNRAIGVIGAGSTVMRANQTRLRRERGAWHDVGVPQEGPPSRPAYPLTRVRGQILLHRPLHQKSIGVPPEVHEFM